ncbi:hypothetical protein ASF18_12940 [Methylobacterium sp. Leaf89]|nr:hypothetical protein ASF18_12940 [Methylobacterium sp. Leaf89]
MGERARLRQIPVKLDLSKAEQLACVRLYRDVRAKLRAVFEAGDLSAYAIHHATGVRTLIDAPAIWLKQARPIFYTGRTVIQEPKVADRLADVVIEQAMFDRWLEARGKELAKTASEAMLRRMGETIGEHEHKLDYGITRAEAFALVAGAAKEYGKEVSERQFRKHVWAPRGSKAGRRTKVQKERFTQHSSDLATQIAALFVDSSAA